MSHPMYLFDTFGKMIESMSHQSLKSLNPEDILNQLKETGALILRGYKPTLSEFVDFSDRFSHDHFRHGVTKLRNQHSTDGTVVDVLAGNHDIDLHGEMYYLPKQPDILWLMCEQAADEGGATTVCDGVQYLEKLPHAIRSRFEQQKIRYVHRWNPEGWQSMFRTKDIREAMIELQTDPRVSEIKNDNEFLLFHYMTSAIRKPKYTEKPAFINSIENIKQYSFMNIVQVEFEDGRPIDDDILQVIHETGESLTHNVNWQSGDVLMVENSRILHGRRAFSGPRKIFTRFSKVA